MHKKPGRKAVSRLLILADSYTDAAAILIRLKSPRLEWAEKALDQTLSLDNGATVYTLSASRLIPPVVTETSGDER